MNKLKLLILILIFILASCDPVINYESKLKKTPTNNSGANPSYDITSLVGDLIESRLSSCVSLDDGSFLVARLGQADWLNSRKFELVFSILDDCSDRTNSTIRSDNSVLVLQYDLIKGSIVDHKMVVLEFEYTGFDEGEIELSAVPDEFFDLNPRFEDLENHINKIEFWKMSIDLAIPQQDGVEIQLPRFDQLFEDSSFEEALDADQVYVLKYDIG